MSKGIELNAFVTNLGKYNEGYLIGEWVKFPVSDDELQEIFERIGISSKPDANGIIYEEYFITDYECELDLGFGEYTSIETLNEAAEALENLTDYEAETVKAIMECGYEETIQDAIEHVDNYILYQNQELIDVAYQIIDECYPEISNSDSMLSRYFDYEAFARDLSYEGYTETSYGVLMEC